MRCLNTVFAILIVAIAVSAQQPPELPQKGSGPGKPLSPQEAQKLFKIDDGLRIELVACEPQIESPVAMQFDPDGRLWVVEMRDYPNGPGKGQKPLGRIRVLEDKDGDGFFETSTIWADNLLFANGLFLWKDGAIVTMAPKITHLRDTKGAGKADKEDVLYAGFAAQNPQLRVSHPNLGLDGWIYCANGLRGGKVISASLPRKRGEEAPKSPPANAGGSPVDLSGMDFKFDPVHLDQYEAITGPGQFGNTFDEWGNRFICDNRHHLRHVVMEQRYIKRNPYLAAPALVEDISVLEDGPLNSGGKVYPLSKNWTTSSLHEGRFTAACGVFIYHGNLLDQASLPRKRGEEAPKSPPANAGGSQNARYHGAAFTCEPTGNLVHMEILTPKGATFEAKPHKKGVEFLATTDDWFRPVFLTHGPEGAMYVVDMYRAVIEHPDFMPPELKNRPDLAAGKDKGRIWRIVPKDHKFSRSPLASGKLSKASIPDLVKTLEHEEPWHRTTAQRLLLEKNDKAMIEPLTKLLEGTKSPHAKILAAWMLERQGKLSDKRLWELVSDANPRVREHGLRIAEQHTEMSMRTFETALALYDDKDARVCFQACLSLGGLDLGPISNLTRTRSLVRAARKYTGDKWARLAVQTAMPKTTLPFLQSWFRFEVDELKEGPGGALLVQDIASLVGAGEEPENVFEAFELLNGTGDSWRWSGVSGLATGLGRRNKTLMSLAAELSKQKRAPYLNAVEKMFSEAGRRIGNAKEPQERRLINSSILSHGTWPIAREALLPLVEKEPNTELRIAALRALAAQQDKEVPVLLMKLWPGAGPSVRREILEAMLRQPARVNVLLDEIESKRLKASELDPLRTRQLSNHKDAAIRERAKKLLADNVPGDRQKVLKEYQAALDFKGDAKNGREVFKKNCAVCHRVAGVGVDVGPDIADTRTKTLQALLFDIIVPNAAIDANYVNYVVATKDGRIVTGLLTAESASSVTLKRAENQMDVVLRKDIDEIASTGISLMPEGLESKISVREMADLLGFLKNWRYLDGTVPIR